MRHLSVGWLIETGVSLLHWNKTVFNDLKAAITKNVCVKNSVLNKKKTGISWTGMIYHNVKTWGVWRIIGTMCVICQLGD
jgi:hypothetical protein